MTAFKGWKTLGFGLLVTLLPTLVAFLGGIDWSGAGLPPYVVSLIGVAIMGLRYVTTTPVGKSV